MTNPTGVTGPRHELACLIVGRNLGDAVIQSLFMRGLIERGFARRYIVWTRPQVAFLYEGLPDCELVTSQFPVGTSKQFDRQGALGFLAAVRQLRRLRPTVSLDLVGDVRERLFARLIGSRRHLHIGWASGHPFAQIIRNPLGTGGPAHVVPADRANVYLAHADFLDALTGGACQAGGSSPSRLRPKGERLHIGLHPFASQDCKLWPDAHWQSLAAQLQQTGATLTAYGAPSERPRLEALFGALPEPVRLVTQSIKSFADDVAGLDLMIGLDSFSVHMAERQGLPSVMLNACNHRSLWQPPHGTVLSESGGCKDYPCMNVPTCEQGEARHVCIQSISVDAVLRALPR